MRSLREMPKLLSSSPPAPSANLRTVTLKGFHCFPSFQRLDCSQGHPSGQCSKKPHCWHCQWEAGRHCLSSSGARPGFTQWLPERPAGGQTREEEGPPGSAREGHHLEIGVLYAQWTLKKIGGTETPMVRQGPQRRKQLLAVEEGISHLEGDRRQWTQG